MKRIMLTGSSGYIGSNLKPYLERHMNVVVVEYDLVHGLNILDRGRLRRSCIDIDAIIHLAAVSSIEECNADPTMSLTTNVAGTSNVAYLAKEMGCKLVFASSCAVKELVNYYAVSKSIGERSVLNVGGVALRLSNVYGGCMEKSEGVYTKFSRAKEKGEEEVVFGDGLHERDFIHIADVCNAFHRALLVDSGTYEVSSGEVISILDLAKTLEVKYRFGEGEVGVRTVKTDPSMWLPDWKPTHYIKH